MIPDANQLNPLLALQKEALRRLDDASKEQRLLQLEAKNKELEGLEA